MEEVIANIRFGLAEWRSHMSKINSSASGEKKNSNFLTATISLMLVVVLLVADIYIIVNRPDHILALIGISALTLLWVYLFVKSLFQEIDDRKQQQDSYFEAILKSEKAFFLMQRKFEDRLAEMEENAKLPSDEIITAQKAIAKVTINRSNEHTVALINSNDKVMEKITNFEEQISSNNDELLDRQKNLWEATAKEILSRQQEIVSDIKEMERSIKNEVQQAVDSISAMQANIPVAVNNAEEPFSSSGESEIQEDFLIQEDSIAEEDPLSMTMEESSGLEETFGLEDLPIGDLFSAEEELPMEEPLAVDETALEEKTESLDELPIEDLFPNDNFSIEESSIEEPLAVDKDILQENAKELDELSIEDLFPNEESAIEEPAVEEPSVEDEALLDEKVAALEELPIEDLFPIENESVEEENPLDEKVSDLEDFSMDDIFPSEGENLSEASLEEIPDLKGLPTDDLLPTEEEASSKEDDLLEEKVAELEELPIEDLFPTEEETIQEEKPPMPDMSNPNRLMTPDEIAALIANM